MFGKVQADREYPKDSADLLRHIAGNPFRPIVLDRAWLRWGDGTIPSLAQAAYENRSLPDSNLDPTRLAVLADALEEAGANQELAGHLRDAIPHPRGCWVVDVLLSKK